MLENNVTETVSAEEIRATRTTVDQGSWEKLHAGDGTKFGNPKTSFS